MAIISNHQQIWIDLKYIVSNVINNLKESKLSVVILVYCSFLVDNILLTMVVPIIPDYLERINMRSEVMTQLNNNDNHFSTQLRQISTSSSTQSPTTPPTLSSSVSFVSQSPSLFVTTTSYGDDNNNNNNIFSRWNQSNESLWSFGEKISYRRLFEGGKVVNQGKEIDEDEEEDDDDDDHDGGGNGEEEDDFEKKKEIGNEDVVKSKRSSNSFTNILMEGDSDLSYNHQGNQPIDWKSLPIRESSKIIKIILEDKISMKKKKKKRKMMKKEKYQNHGKDSKRIDYDKSHHEDNDEKDDEDNSYKHHLQSSNSHSKQHLHLHHHHHHSHHHSTTKTTTTTTTTTHHHLHHYHFHNHFRHSSNFHGNQGVIGDDKIDDYQEERLVGTLFASKAIFQLIFNPISRKLIQSYGHNLIQIVASMILLISALIYAFSIGFKTMFLARCIHGIGSSIISISGMARIANLFQDEKSRCQVMGLSLGGMAVGVLIGYPFGGFAYDFLGKQIPFLLIAFLFFAIIGCQITFLPMEKEIDLQMENSCSQLTQMVEDLDIMIAIGSIFFTTSITAVLEPVLPIYLIDSLHASEWQLGIVFLPDSFGYIIGTHILGFDKHSIDKWTITITSLFLAGFSTILIPLTTHFYQLILPQFISGLSIGITDAAMSTILASIVDDRYSSNYSMIYTFSQTAVCLAYIIGPIASSIILTLVGTTGTVHTLGTIVILYGIVCVSYRIYLAETNGHHWSQAITIHAHQPYETL